MLTYEYFMTRPDGKVINRYFSDEGYMIRIKGEDNLYEAAIDFDGLLDKYEETDILPSDLEKQQDEEAEEMAEMEKMMEEEHDTEFERQ